MSNAALSAAAERTLALAKSQGCMLATVESCTAGALAALLADAPGAGEFSHGGFVVYTKANKTAAVGVPSALIDAHTAVSREVVLAMAGGALERCPADVVLAITGVAGPEPDEDGNPVGLLHVAVVSRKGGVRHLERRYDPAPKQDICGAAMLLALSLADDMIKGALEAQGDASCGF
jgi:PncC family amidohydrolase